MEWFGSTDPSLGPTNDNLQEQNAKTILLSIGADLYAVVEVVDEARLANIVSQMPGYQYVICDYGSHTNTNESGASPISEAQKEAFIYKTSVFSNISTTALLSQGTNSVADLSNPAYNYWSSGRFPFLMSADVTLNCVTKNVKFVLVHAKANTSPTATAYARRKSGADTLYYTLNQLFPNDNIVILGDFNDDLDQSITAGFTTTSWNSFTNDATNYTALTLPLSLAGKRSTTGFNDMIDHVIVSNEMAPYYMPATANVLNDVTSLVSNYGSTTSDHFPIFTRYQFEQPAPPVITCNENIVVDNDKGKCGAVVTYAVNVTGGCGAYDLVQTMGLPSGSEFPVGVTLNSFIVTDGAGNAAMCTFSVTVNDTEDPIITCPGNLSVPNDAGTCGAVVNYEVTSSDNCTGTTVEQVAGLASGAVFPVGQTINTFTVTDATGRSATCSFTATYTDNVSSCGNTVTITRTWRLADANGNQAPAQPLAFVPNRILSAATDGPNPPFYIFSGNTSGLSNLTVTGTLYGKIIIEEGAQVTFAPAGGVINVENMIVDGSLLNNTRVMFGGCTSVQ
ncbi:HYR domain protein, partial [Ostertagia ostertagi]